MSVDWRYWPGGVGVRSKEGSKLPNVCAVLLPLALAALALSASALTVTVTAPTPGVWTASDTIGVSGTASAPNPDRRVLDTTADFASGSEINVNTSGDRVTVATSQTETFQYAQNFTGLALSATIDSHWMWNLTGTFWQVTNDGTLSADPPSLSHSGTTTQHVYWDSLLAGPLVDGRVKFGYLCQANAFINVYVSADGSFANRTALLTTGGSVSGTSDTNVTSLVSGTRSLYVHFEVGASSATNSFCSVDDFQVTADLDVSQGLGTRVQFGDTFSAGANSVWNGYDTGWAVGSPGGVSDTEPALYHIATGTTSAWANWGSSTPIVNASLSFHYQCQANAALQAYLSRDGTTETRILNGARGAAHTVFTYNATALLLGSTAMFLRFASDATTTPNYFCGVDDVAISWNVTGYLNVTYAGSYATPPIDMGAAAAMTTADWVAVTPVQTTVSVSFRSSMDGSVYTAWAPLSSSGASVAGTARYGQFRVNLTTNGVRPLPYLDRIALNFSALIRVEVSVNGGSWALAVGTSNWAANVSLAGGSNNITARVTDTSGATVLSVVQVLRDTFPPSAPGKPTGPAVTNQTSASWVWGAATDVGLGIDHYTVDVGLTPGGAELGADLPATGANFTMTGLPDNIRVYATAFAVDGAGLVSLTGMTSDATLVDRTAPGVPTVRAQTLFTQENAVTWNWTAAPESGSGVALYAVRVGTTPGGAEVQTATTAGLNYTFGAGVSGQTYYLSVAGVDIAGNQGAFASSPAVTVDQGPPTSPAPVTAPSTVTNSTALTWSWTASTDALSGVDHYLVTLGTSQGGSDVETLAWASTSYTASSIAPGMRYFFEVRAVDLAGNVGPAATAPGVLVDDESPSQPVAHAMQSFQANASVSVSWNASVDAPSANGSGVDHYVVRVADGTNVNVTSVTGLDTSFAVTDGTHYSVTIAAVDLAGNEGVSSSVSFTSDRSGPAAPVGLKVVVLVPTGPTLQASWNGTVDAGSGVKEYRISIGTTPGGTDVASGRVVTGTTEKWTGTFGKTYYVTVWAIDLLGNAGPSTSTTQGVTATKPTEGGGSPGLEASAAVMAVLGAALIVGLRRRQK
jgi:hypothetical protein